MAIIYVPRVSGSTLILTVAQAPPLTAGPVIVLLADQQVNVTTLADVPRAISQLNDSQIATAVLSEKVV